MIIWHNAQLPPAIHHGKKTEMVVADFLRRLLTQAELIEKLVVQQQFILYLARSEHCSSSGVNTFRELLPMPTQHKLE